MLRRKRNSTRLSGLIVKIDEGGSYMALRLVQMHLETWDRTNLQEQEKSLAAIRNQVPFGKKVSLTSRSVKTL
ncbi:MAG: hypothetical protein ACLS6Y_06570 [Streptococcus salivarius]